MTAYGATVPLTLASAKVRFRSPQTDPAHGTKRQASTTSP
jgi:hypothetical protein